MPEVETLTCVRPTGFCPQAFLPSGFRSPTRRCPRRGCAARARPGAFCLGPPKVEAERVAKDIHRRQQRLQVVQRLPLSAGALSAVRPGAALLRVANNGELIYHSHEDHVRHRAGLAEQPAGGHHLGRGRLTAQRTPRVADTARTARSRAAWRGTARLPDDLRGGEVAAQPHLGGVAELRSSQPKRRLSHAAPASGNPAACPLAPGRAWQFIAHPSWLEMQSVMRPADGISTLSTLPPPLRSRKLSLRVPSRASRTWVQGFGFRVLYRCLGFSGFGV